MSDCGGCRNLGAHSPRCHTQSGYRWVRWADIAESLGDQIGPNDMKLSTMAWVLAGELRLRSKMKGDDNE